MNKFVKFLGQSRLFQEPISIETFKSKNVGTKVLYKGKFYIIHDIIISYRNQEKIYILS